MHGLCQCLLSWKGQRRLLLQRWQRLLSRQWRQLLPRDRLSMLLRRGRRSKLCTSLHIARCCNWYRQRWWQRGDAVVRHHRLADAHERVSEGTEHIIKS